MKTTNKTIDTLRNAALFLGWENFNVSRKGDLLDGCYSVEFDVAAKNGNGFWMFTVHVNAAGEIVEASKSWGNVDGDRGNTVLLNPAKILSSFGLFVTAEAA